MHCLNFPAHLQGCPHLGMKFFFSTQPSCHRSLQSVFWLIRPVTGSPGVHPSIQTTTSCFFSLKSCVCSPHPVALNEPTLDSQLSDSAVILRNTQMELESYSFGIHTVFWICHCCSEFPVPQSDDLQVAQKQVQKLRAALVDLNMVPIGPGAGQDLALPNQSPLLALMNFNLLIWNIFWEK